MSQQQQDPSWYDTATDWLGDTWDYVTDTGDGGFIDSVGDYFTTSSGGLDTTKIAGLVTGVGGVANALGLLPSSLDSNKPTGYQGKAEKKEFVRDRVQDTYDPNRRPGSGGQRYFSQGRYGRGDELPALRERSLTEAQGYEMLNKANPAQEMRSTPAMAQGGPVQGYFGGGGIRDVFQNFRNMPRSNNTVDQLTMGPQPQAMPKAGATAGMKTPDNPAAPNDIGLPTGKNPSIVAGLQGMIDEYNKTGGNPFPQYEYDPNAPIDPNNPFAGEGVGDGTDGRAPRPKPVVLPVDENGMSPATSQPRAPMPAQPTGVMTPADRQRLQQQQQQPSTGMTDGFNRIRQQLFPNYQAPPQDPILDALRAQIAQRRQERNPYYDKIPPEWRNYQPIPLQQTYNRRITEPRPTPLQQTYNRRITEPRPTPAQPSSRNFDFSSRRRRPFGFADGGIASMAPKGYYLGGPTDGMADKVPATIDQKQPAALSDGEFVIPADVVSHLGNGNSTAGAEQLYGMMDRIRQARTGNKEQGKEINPNKFTPA